MEAMEMHGPEAWRQHNVAMEELRNRVRSELSRLGERTDLVNQRRKRRQEEAAPRLEVSENGKPQWPLAIVVAVCLR